MRKNLIKKVYLKGNDNNNNNNVKTNIVHNDSSLRTVNKKEVVYIIS